jgi:hypothetical protein
MSKLSTLVAGLVFAGWCVAASSAVAEPRFYAGAKGGVILADVSGDGVDEAGTKTGFDGGAVVGADLTPHFGARVEALYVKKGAEGEIVTPGDDHPHESTWSLDYLEFPLLVTGRIPVGTLTASAFAGPTFGFNLRSEIETTHGTEDLDGITRAFELGGAFGAGLEYWLSRFALGAEVRYSLGATSVIEDVAGQSIDIKNRGLGILATVRVAIAE